MSRIVSRVKRAMAQRSSAKVDQVQGELSEDNCMEANDVADKVLMRNAVQEAIVSRKPNTTVLQSNVASHDKASMQAVTSPTKSFTRSNMDTVSTFWTEEQAGSITLADAKSSYDWDDDDTYNVSRCPCRKCDEGFIVPQTTFDDTFKAETPTKENQVQPAVTWMSPIETVHSFDTSSTSGKMLRSKAITLLQPTSPKENAIKCVDTARRPVEKPHLFPDDMVQQTNLAVPTNASKADESVIEPVDVSGIWRRNPSKSFAPKLPSKDNAYSTYDEENLLCITFTPSEDVDDHFMCYSPVAVDPEDIEQGDLTKEHKHKSIVSPIKCSTMSIDFKYRQKEWSHLSKLLTILLVVACLTGHASRLLSQYDVPEAVVRLVYTANDYESRRTLIQRYNESKLSVFDSPGKFLDIRQNTMGVWLK